MADKNYYEALGLSPDATDEEIKHAFRKLAHEVHPDAPQNRNKTHMRFLTVLKAYQTLSDQNKRKEYDAINNLGSYRRERGTSLNDHTAATGNREADMLRNLREKFQNESSGHSSGLGRFSTPPPPNAQEKPKNVGLLQKIFGNRHSRKDDITEAKDSAEQIQDSQIYSFRLAIDAMESLRNAHREVAVEIDGIVRKAIVNIPALIEDGTVLQIPHVFEDDQRTFLLTIEVQVLDHQFLSREGNDLILRLPITIGEAISGGDVEVPTTGTAIKIRIPPFSFYEKKLRIPGKGIKGGDLYITPQIVPPPVVSEVLKQMADGINTQYLGNVREKIPRKLG